MAGEARPPLPPLTARHWRIFSWLFSTCVTLSEYLAVAESEVSPPDCHLPVGSPGICSCPEHILCCLLVYMHIHIGLKWVQKHWIIKKCSLIMSCLVSSMSLINCNSERNANVKWWIMNLTPNTNVYSLLCLWTALKVYCIREGGGGLCSRTIVPYLSSMLVNERSELHLMCRCTLFVLIQSDMHGKR